MISAATIDAMIAAGASAEVIGAAWKAELRMLEEATAARRESDRERQRSHRASRVVTECNSDNADVTGGHTEKKSPQTPKENPPLNGSPKGEPIPPPKSRKPRALEFEVPDWIPPEAWAAFAEMRRRKKKPLDDYTAKQLFGRLRSIRDAGWSLEDVINKAAIGNHDGFWMPDGRDSNIRRTNGAAGGKGRPMNAEELRAGIRFAEDNQDPERAAELKRQLAALTAKPADPAVARLVHSATDKLRVRA